MIEAQNDYIIDVTSEVLNLINQNFKTLQDEVNEYKILFKEDKKINNYLDTVNKHILKLKSNEHEIQKFISRIFHPSNFEEYSRLISFKKKIFLKIVQLKYFSNFLIKLIIKIKKLMMIKQKPNILETDSNFCIDHLTHDDLTENNFIIIEKNSYYDRMVKEVCFSDDSHSKYAADVTDYDLGAIIAFSLASDSYSQYICKNNKLKLVEIKCERKDKSMKEKIDLLYNNFDYLNPSLQSRPVTPKSSMVNQVHILSSVSMDKSDESKKYDDGHSNSVAKINTVSFRKDKDNKITNYDKLENKDTKENKEVKENKDFRDAKYNIENEDKNLLASQDEEVYKTLLLFDPSRNNYNFQNLGILLYFI